MTDTINTALKWCITSSMEKVLPWKAPSCDGAEQMLHALRGERVSFQIAYLWNGRRKSRGQIRLVQGSAAQAAEHMVAAEAMQSVKHTDAAKKAQAAPLSECADKVSVYIRQVLLSPCAYPCHPGADDGYMDTRPGLYPDLLREIDANGFSLVAGQWRSLWIDLRPGKDVKPGTYVFTFRLEEIHPEAADAGSDSEGSILAEATIRLQVLGADLPDVPIPHTEWFHCDALANYYHVDVFSERHWELIENFVRTAVDHGCNMLLTPLFTPPLDTAVGGERRTVQLVDVEVVDDVQHHCGAAGSLDIHDLGAQRSQNVQNPDAQGSQDVQDPATFTYRFSFEKLERWVEMARRCGIRYFEMSHLFTQWGAGHAPKIVALVNGKEEKIFGWETQAAKEGYSRFLHLFLAELDKELHKLGIAQDCFFHISDEPSIDHLESYKAAKAIVDDQLKEYRIIDALSDFTFYQTGIIKEPVCGEDHLPAFLENRPEKLWTYYCTAQHTAVPNRFIAQYGCRTRILGILLYKYQIDGFLQWGYNFYNSEYSLYPIDPYNCTDADGAFPSGDPFLVYPGKNGMPESSIRLMLMDEAFADLRAMTLLEQLTDRQTVLACLYEEEVGELRFDKFPHDAEYIRDVRERINRKIYSVLE